MDGQDGARASVRTYVRKTESGRQAGRPADGWMVGYR